MNEFLHLHNVYGTDILVNMNNVTKIAKSPYEIDLTEIHFTSGEKIINVKESLDSIYQTLQYGKAPTEE